MPVAKEPYGRLPDGTEIDLYTLSNAAGMRVKVITYGAILAEVVVPDREGKTANVNLVRDSLADYVADSACLRRPSAASPAASPGASSPSTAKNTRWP